MKAKKEILNFLIGSFVWVLFLRVITGEKIIFNSTRLGLVIIIAIVISVFIEYRVRKKFRLKVVIKKTTIFYIKDI